MGIGKVIGKVIVSFFLFLFVIGFVGTLSVSQELDGRSFGDILADVAIDAVMEILEAVQSHRIQDHMPA